MRVYTVIPSTSFWCINPIALRKTKVVYNFGLSECNRVQKITVSHRLVAIGAVWVKEAHCIFGTAYQRQSPFAAI